MALLALALPSAANANVVAPAVPATTVPATNTFSVPVAVAVSGGTVTAISVNGVSTGATSGLFVLAPTATIAITYTGVPAWTWTAAGPYIADPQFKTGTIMSSLYGLPLAGNTGFTIPWTPGLMLAIVAGTTAPGAVTLVNPGSGVSPAATLAAGSTFAFGPIWSSFASPTTGLVQVNVATVTTAAVAAYLLPSLTGASHGAFETNPQAADY